MRSTVDDVLRSPVTFLDDCDAIRALSLTVEAPVEIFRFIR